MTRPDPRRPRRNRSGAAPSRWWRSFLITVRHEDGFGRETAGPHGRVVAVITGKPVK